MCRVRNVGRRQRICLGERRKKKKKGKIFVHSDPDLYVTVYVSCLGKSGKRETLGIGSLELFGLGPAEDDFLMPRYCTHSEVKSTQVSSKTPGLSHVGASSHSLVTCNPSSGVLSLTYVRREYSVSKGRCLLLLVKCVNGRTS